MAVAPTPHPQPTFLCIGAARCGTSWLYENLARHPRVWMPPLKEIHYFDRSTRYESPSYLADDELAKRLFGGSAHNRDLRRRVLRALFFCGGQLHLRKLAWHLRYLLRTPSDGDWYHSLFRGAGDRIAGDITPGYSLLDSDDVARVKALLPSAQVILILRNPIDRDWSSNHPIGALSEAEHLRRIEEPGNKRRGDYLAMLANWERHYPPKQILVAFFDDLAADPQGFLLQILAFLRVQTDPATLDAVCTAKINATPKGRPDIPPAIRSHLARRHLPALRVLSDRFGGHTGNWLAEAETVLC